MRDAGLWAPPGCPATWPGITSPRKDNARLGWAEGRVDHGAFGREEGKRAGRRDHTGRPWGEPTAICRHSELTDTPSARPAPVR